MLCEVLVEVGDGTAGGFGDADEDLDGGGLPCSVWAEEADDFAFGYVEGDTVYGGEVFVFFDEMMDFENVYVFSHLIIILNLTYSC